ncbi:MAG: 50S ribosomal protein L33 [Candidatus Omnitrophica bacterium]|nr:50S ribosomal protein L33 [Candidatus Omnitrophota bacterium]MBU1047011.1 50S ribosomal protein L33 [Candidatus Omnitrophota bacterium]MBU1631356.1 50S ribosomal protein L33 [Candidatus Omnitrophota bacterium]MBU1767316.1 50S ribosomal protein L33 [Candidatus Omnitrophota bacterium]MBU1889623.1 50S ribosomal protein L33 [Candidatus Omnitrophota bacterium]
MREFITLVCEFCKNRNYATSRSKEQRENKLALKKFCRFCRKHSLHKETK